jgi:hypothetical protein
MVLHPEKLWKMIFVRFLLFHNLAFFELCVANKFIFKMKKFNN